MLRGLGAGAGALGYGTTGFHAGISLNRGHPNVPQNSLIYYLLKNAPKKYKMIVPILPCMRNDICFLLFFWLGGGGGAFLSKIVVIQKMYEPQANGFRETSGYGRDELGFRTPERPAWHDHVFV